MINYEMPPIVILSVAKNLTESSLRDPLFHLG